MFKTLKKASARLSARQIATATVRLIDTLLPYEGELASLSPQDPNLDSKIPRILDAAISNRGVQEAVRALETALLGPIPIDCVREDVFKLFLSAQVPANFTGVIVKKAFRDVIASATAHERKELGGMQDVWRELRQELSGGNASLLSLGVDPRFADL